MPWWDWERWEREIDLMAMNGTTMALAIVGMEELWLNFLVRFGYTQEQATAFIAGPAFTSWWLMGNLEGHGGPVTDSWIKERTYLQKRILNRMRELGIEPVLPAFVGLVPNNLKNKFPKAEILDQGKWLDYDRPDVLHPNDPLFDEMAQAWYEELDKLYGKTNMFSGDLFHEGGKTNGLDIGNVAAKVQKKMNEYNPDAVWTLQGWGGNPKKELLQDLDNNRTIVVELCSEYFRNWEKTDGFSDKDWIFSTIVQYGGNTGLHGRLDAIANNLQDAMKTGNPPVGIGTSWESIQVNDVVNDFLADLRWESDIPELETWVVQYARRRYGFSSENSEEAWKTILKTAYGVYEGHRRPTESIFCARPSLNVKKASAFTASIKVHYDQRVFSDAINLLLADSEIGQEQPTYKYDVVDFTRQFLANAAQIPYQQMVEAFHSGNLPKFNEASGQFLQLLNDQDRLLATESNFLLGKWINDARMLGTNKQQAAINEKNARMLVTTWTEGESILRDYAWREWNGLLKTYYKLRWEMFIEEMKNRLKGQTAREIDFYSFERSWMEQTWEEQSYNVIPSGNPINISKEILEKWSFLIDDPMLYNGPDPKLSVKKESSTYAR